MAQDETQQALEDLKAEVDRLGRRCAALEAVVARQQRQLSVLDGLAAEVRKVHFWDHSVYDVTPDESWLAVDRVEVLRLLGALAEVDHWKPWQTTVERRS